MNGRHPMNDGSRANSEQDLVERLRLPSSVNHRPEAERAEAADEIERLRADLDKVVRRYDQPVSEGE